MRGGVHFSGLIIFCRRSITPSLTTSTFIFKSAATGYGNIEFPPKIVHSPGKEFIPKIGEPPKPVLV
jgi:hypothetical protein